MAINPNMGRPRKPSSLQTGNNISKAEKERLMAAEKELQGETDMVMDIPDHLDNDAKKFYGFIVKELEVSNLLSNLDIPLVEQIADALSKIRQCDKIINSEGLLIYEDKNGIPTPKEHPIVGIKMKYLDRFRTLSTQIGMSPSSRSQLANLNLEKIEEEGDILLKILKD